MTPYERHLLSSNAATAIRRSLRVRSSRKQVSRDIRVQWLARLRVTVNLDVNGMVQQRKPSMLFVDVSAAIEEFTKKRKITPLDCLMSRAQVIHQGHPRKLRRRSGSMTILHIRAFSTSISQPGAAGSKPCSISQRTARRLRNDHHAWITLRSTSAP